MYRPTAALLALAVLAAAPAASQEILKQAQVPGVFLPLQSPRAQIEQTVGMTEIALSYHRPAVNERTIWGGLVPYGQVWRTGANENTLISFSTDATIQGQPLPAGVYGLHTIPGEAEWSVIFSRDTTAWGSFSYDQANDALRVTAVPEAAPHRERLTFSFTDLEDDSTTLQLHWEKVRLPIRIQVATDELTIASFHEQLKGLSQFSWLGWNQAAGWAEANDVELEQALAWADSSIQIEERFENLATRSRILAKLDRTEEAGTAMDRALERANAGQLHNYGRQMIAAGDKARAMEVFEMNAERNPEVWFVHVGLARGLSSRGEFTAAADAMKVAHERAPEAQKAYIAGLVERLEAGQDIN